MTLLIPSERIASYFEAIVVGVLQLLLMIVIVIAVVDDGLMLIGIAVLIIALSVGLALFRGKPLSWRGRRESDEAHSADGS